MTKYFLTPEKDIEFVYIENESFFYKEHSHVSIHTVGILLKGKVQLRNQGKENTYLSGSSFHILPYSVHSIQASDFCTMLVVCIKKDIFKRMTLEKLLKLFKDYVHLMIEKKILNKNDFLDIYDVLKDIYTNEKNCISYTTFSPLKDKIENNANEPYTLEEMSKMCKISKYHFAREFKKNLDLSPHQFLIQNRVRKAQRLLQKNHTLTDIGITSGFYDQSHFIRHFKKYFPVSPIEYKKACELLELPNTLLEKI